MRLTTSALLKLGASFKYEPEGDPMERLRHSDARCACGGAIDFEPDRLADGCLCGRYVAKCLACGNRYQHQPPPPPMEYASRLRALRRSVGKPAGRRCENPECQEPLPSESSLARRFCFKCSERRKHERVLAYQRRYQARLRNEAKQGAAS